MGVVCSCTKPHDPLQVQGFSAIKIRPQSQLLTTLDPVISPESIKQDLNTYLTANKATICKPLLKLYESAVIAPDKGLESVKIKQWRMRDDDWKHLGRLCDFYWLIAKLMVWKITLSTNGFKALCGCLERLKALKALSLCDLGLGNHNLEILSQTFGKLFNLQHLVLKLNDLLPEQMAILVPALASLPDLQELVLDDNRIGDMGCAALSNGVKAMERLTLLSVRNNAITHVGCAELMRVAGQRPSLKVFLEGNEIGEEDLEGLQAAISM
jgi:hypothetical protein